MARRPAIVMVWTVIGGVCVAFGTLCAIELLLWTGLIGTKRNVIEASCSHSSRGGQSCNGNWVDTAGHHHHVLLVDTDAGAIGISRRVPVWHGISDYDGVIPAVLVFSFSSLRSSSLSSSYGNERVWPVRDARFAETSRMRR